MRRIDLSNFQVATSEKLGKLYRVADLLDAGRDIMRKKILEDRAVLPVAINSKQFDG